MQNTQSTTLYRLMFSGIAIYLSAAFSSSYVETSERMHALTNSSRQNFNTTIVHNIQNKT